ncbi:unnamed protein product [Brassicogethes aeneus]|uniref:Uncharacterized protein n=1 Tax=Brassicogethes aeneus TaxID=1431903 RepID=A0A9P0AXK5_BRAAE|nr:unnamed protein product [Brassicogethes aeneus]
MTDKKKQITIEDVFNKLINIEAKADENQSSLNEIKNSLNQLKNEVSTLEKENQVLKDKFKKVEHQFKKNNIIVFGCPKDNTLEKNLLLLQKALGININQSDINNIYEIGEEKSEISKPLKIKLISFLKKKEILKNAYKLKELKETKNINIFISDDLSKEDQDIQKELRKYLNTAKKNKLKTKIVKNTLIVEDVSYTLENLKKNRDINFEKHDQQDIEVENSSQEKKAEPKTRTTRSKK